MDVTISNSIWNNLQYAELPTFVWQNLYYKALWNLQQSVGIYRKPIPIQTGKTNIAWNYGQNVTAIIFDVAMLILLHNVSNPSFPWTVFYAM